MFISSIHDYSSTKCGVDLNWAAISCLGLQTLLDQSPGPVSNMADCIRCFVNLTKKLLQDDHGQPLQVLEIPVKSLGYAAISTGSSFAPYLRSMIDILEDISTRIPSDSCEPVHWAAGGVIGDCITAVGGGGIRPYLPFLVQYILKLGESSYPRLRLTAHRVLTSLTSECPGTMSPYLDQLVAVLLNCIWRTEPNVISISEWRPL